MTAWRFFAVTVAAFVTATPTAAWKIGGTSTGAATVKFGTHDYVAHHGYRLADADDVAWLTPLLNYYYLGTEAPDVGPKHSSVLTGSFGGQSVCRVWSAP